MIPTAQREDIEADINRLLDAGWGELTITVVNHAIAGHIVSVSRVYNRKEKD